MANPFPAGLSPQTVCRLLRDIIVGPDYHYSDCWPEVIQLRFLSSFSELGCSPLLETSFWSSFVAGKNTSNLSTCDLFFLRPLHLAHLDNLGSSPCVEAS